MQRLRRETGGGTNSGNFDFELEEVVRSKVPRTVSRSSLLRTILTATGAVVGQKMVDPRARKILHN